MVKRKKKVEEIDEDEYSEYPIVIIAGDPQKCIWPIMIRLEQYNGIRLHACEPYMPTVSRIKELTGRYLEEVDRRKIVVKNRKTNQELEITETVFEFIPACKR